MKLNIFYDSRDKEFLLTFSSISEMFFIEYSGFEVNNDWEAASDDSFFEKLSKSDNILIILSSNSVNNKWISYVMGFADGKGVNCHLFSRELNLPDWCDSFNISKTESELLDYYRKYTEVWFDDITVVVAKKTLTDRNKDITLTAFVEVIIEGDCLLAGIYLDAGFKAHDRDRNGVPLICWAAREKQLNMVKLLIRAGADINAISEDRNDTALIDAVSEDDAELVSFILLYDPNLEIQTKNGQTALIIASGHNNLEIVKLLYDKEPNIDTKDKLGMSALSYAKLQQNEEIIKLFTG
ncbi:MAG: ankyrin repeat domain-containing protein [Deltaproteobacteria bacterium]|nr:ankyrin repeat domain-containing protein [Deltaproteobacteria bacterium]